MQQQQQQAYNGHGCHSAQLLLMLMADDWNGCCSPEDTMPMASLTMAGASGENRKQTSGKINNQPR